MKKIEEPRNNNTKETRKKSAPSTKKKSRIKNSQVLFDENLQLFKQRVPEIASILRDYKPISKLVTTENGEPDIVFQAFNMYSSGAKSHAKKQLEKLDTSSTRFQLAEPLVENLDAQSQEIMGPLIKQFKESGLKFASQPTSETAYFVITLGLGLGQHLMELVQRTQCRVLLIIEPNRDLMFHSLKVFDWKELFDHFEDFGDLEFYFGENPEYLTEAVRAIFRRYNPSALDGTLVFNHYTSSLFKEFHRRIQSQLLTAIVGLGFFTDEINMISQTYKNLEKGDARVIKVLDKDPQIPAFIVGSGPSITELLPFIKENQDKAIIISCGTSIDILLNNDIKPDFWAIAERDVDILYQARETKKLYGTKDIRFVGSTTIFPGVYDLFKDPIFFFRPALAPTPIFAKEEQVAVAPDPLAANAGLSVGIHFGFRTFYLMGVDVGSQHKSHGHAPGSWYERHDAETYTEKQLNIPAPGNFGGKVWTTAELEWSRKTLEGLIAVSSGRIFNNLGRGALIKGAAPRHPKTIQLEKSQKPKEDILKELVAACDKFTTSEFEDKWERAAIIDRLFNFCENLKLATKVEADPSGFLFARRTSRILGPLSMEEPIPMLIRGTIFSVFIAYNYYLNRLIDNSERPVMQKLFKDEYCKFIDKLRNRAVEIFSGVEEGKRWKQFIK